MPSKVDFEAWFRLLATPGLGRVNVRRLLAAFGSPEAVLRAPPSALSTVVGADMATAIAGPAPPELAPRLAHALRWLQAGAEHHVLTLGEALYPPQLLQSPDPPLMLFVRGAVARLSAPALAIVGSRHASPPGLENAREFASALSAQGLVIVSGLALGIDAAAHEGALRGPAGTVAVLGCGPDEAYPPRHAALAERIAANGALVSEYAPGTPPLAEHFPQRNRIIAGLSLGTLVVEAALRSGSLITARLASEAGREVFAIPGSIHSPHAKGCHALIKQGAKLVEVATDILEELRLPVAQDSKPPVPAVEEPDLTEEPVLAALGHDPTSLDSLSARTGWPVHELAARLLELELEGRVARLPGGMYQRIGHA